MIDLSFTFDELIFREIEEKDLLQLQNISRITFEDTFGWYNSKDDMEHYLNVSLSLDNLKNEFKTIGSNFYFVELNNKIIAFLKINRGFAQTEKDLPNTLEIERIYILKEYKGLKIGTFLLNKAKEIVKKENLDYLWLAVWEKNENAIKFYQKHNFEIFGEHDFVLGSDVQKDFLMKLK